MSFFQNPFVSDFKGFLVFSDRQYNLTFSCPRNAGRSDAIVMNWNDGPFDLSGNDADGNSRANLRLQFALDPVNNFKDWTTLSIDITSEAASSSAVTTTEIAAALSADATFKELFTATVDYAHSNKLLIKQQRPVPSMRFYVLNGRAEEAMRFNGRAGVSELPTYFARHTIANRYTYDDSQNMLIELSPNAAGGSSQVDDDIIENAVNAKGVSLALDNSTIQADWQLLEGRVGLFMFQKITVDGSDRITEIIEYPAGAVAGMMARKIEYSYTGANKHPSQITEIPHTLAGGDLVTP